ncbi:MAG: hypothetical protein ABW199_00185 [Caulobacterales bacterium]
MLSKRIGEPCPKCSTGLQRRRTRNRGDVMDIAYCASCNASFELSVEEEIEAPALFVAAALPA